jgi:small conductance mechanosensitive channel
VGGSGQSGRGRRGAAAGRGSTARRHDARRYRTGAESRLRRFRQGSILAVAMAALLLLLIGEAAPAETEPGPGGALAVAQVAQDAPVPVAPVPVAPGTDDPGRDDAAGDPPGRDTAAPDPAEAAREATGTLRDLALDFYGALPAIGIALGLLVVAAVLAKLVGLAIRLGLGSWERAQATAALTSIFIWLVAIGAALSVLSGDARALVGSVGLFGLALSWALQAPIESFTGWLLNSFRSYYRIGDRILVGDVFGDVARIDFLTTTVFEAGGADQRVQAAQSTGAMVTFPNLEVLRSNIVNFTQDFPYVWDELTVGVANESDLPLAVRVLEETADRVLGESMQEGAEQYARLLERSRLAWDVATRPQVFASAGASWTDLTIRYAVPAREMRLWSSRLLLAVNAALAEPDVARRVYPAYPRNHMQPLPPPRWATAAEAGRPEGGDGPARPSAPASPPRRSEDDG